MNIAKNPENIAAGLTVPERILLFCVATGTDWEKSSSVTAGAVAAMILKGLVERDAVGRLTLSDEGRAVVGVLLKGG